MSTPFCLAQVRNPRNSTANFAQPHWMASRPDWCRTKVIHIVLGASALDADVGNTTSSNDDGMAKYFSTSPPQSFVRQSLRALFTLDKSQSSVSNCRRLSVFLVHASFAKRGRRVRYSRFIVIALLYLLLDLPRPIYYDLIHTPFSPAHVD